tara:strand:+ start:86 stop:631 length:546 start_codon:yes stop_codon:yes gene_type:complete
MEIKSICVFCGASKGNNTAYLNSARNLGIELASNQIRLIYGGGGSGLMGCLANSAIKSGGKVTGVIPRYLKSRELENRNLTKLEVVSDMHERKKRMFDLADGIVVLPGGIGTLEETLEVITWKQLGMHKKPIIIVNIMGYWNKLDSLVKDTINAGFAGKQTLTLYQKVEKPEEVVPALENL